MIFFGLNELHHGAVVAVVVGGGDVVVGDDVVVGGGDVVVASGDDVVVFSGVNGRVAVAIVCDVVGVVVVVGFDDLIVVACR